jgi:GTP-binding protein Era
MPDTPASEEQTGFRSGFVSILGRPNAGKSTLLNALVGQKLAIVSDKPQTTRTTIQGVLTTPGAQVVFLDTPGIHQADTLINQRMMARVAEALEGRDLLVYVVDSTREPQPADQQAVEMVKAAGAPVICVLNKIDRLQPKSRLLPLIERYRTLAGFAEIIPASAIKGDGLDIIRDAILSRLPEGPAYFPEDYVTDQPERFLVAELIREKILDETREEVPHSVNVTIDQWEEKRNLTHVAATITVERPGQKVIVVGEKAARLKKIGTLARLEIEKLLGRKFFLELFVRVRERWRENAVFLSEVDWR